MMDNGINSDEFHFQQRDFLKFMHVGHFSNCGIENLVSVHKPNAGIECMKGQGTGTRE